jgi:N-acetylmuramoyl-L-alanine amidase
MSPLCVALALALATQAPAPPARGGGAPRTSKVERPARKAAKPVPVAARREPAARKPAPRAAAPKRGAQAGRRPVALPAKSPLEQARAQLRAVQRDPAKRRYRHHWEKAIAALERAARGGSREAALLDAARARYALYRFSAVEADRDAALRLAGRAGREGRALAAAIRREAGEAPEPEQREVARAPAPPAAPAPAVTPKPHDEPPSTDPVLDRVLAQLAAEAAEEEEGEGGSTAPPTATSPPTAYAPPAPTATPPPFPAESPPDPSLERILAQLAAAPPRPKPTRPEGLRRVVVDAGHGGHDTGAIGPTGVREKDVALAIVLRLAAKLRADGFEVVLTRDRDEFLALEERTAIANQKGGDLFVSIHANAHPRRDRRGVETYVLDVANDRYAKRLATRENGILEEEGEAPEVRRILADLDAKASAGPSRRLAGLVQRELTGAIRARYGEVRDLGVKSALFYVLLGARMPAVLVETSFLSNREEERRLRSSRFQEDAAAAVARAVRAFADAESRVAAAP